MEVRSASNDRRRFTRFLTALAALAAASLVALGCGSEQADGEGAPRPPESRATAVADTGDTGLPVTAPQGPIDEELARKGEGLFSSKGCVACHTVGKGRLVGPDLKGVTDLRSFAWMFHMVSNPDSMLKSDSTAKALLGTYMVPMANQHVQPEEFRALYEYLRKESQGEGETQDQESEAPESSGEMGMMSQPGRMMMRHRAMHAGATPEQSGPSESTSNGDSSR